MKRPKAFIGIAVFRWHWQTKLLLWLFNRCFQFRLARRVSAVEMHTRALKLAMVAQTME